MDNFFTQTTCDRCGSILNGRRTMSMFNTDCICTKCSEEEKCDKEYSDALKADRDQIKKGNYNFIGIRGGNKTN